MAVTTTHEQAALRVADWRAQAALEGKTFAEVATAAMKARFTGRKLLTAAEAWGNLSDRTREVLVIMCTDRPSANRVRWDMLTEAEKPPQSPADDDTEAVDRVHDSRPPAPPRVRSRP